MAFQTLAVQSQSNAQATAACEVWVASSTDRVMLMEISFKVDAGASPQNIFGFGLPAVKGLGRTLSATNKMTQQDMAALASTTYVATAWTTGPTVPTNFFRRTSIANTTGISFAWTFPNGILIPPLSSLVLWNIANNDIVDIEVVIDE